MSDDGSDVYGITMRSTGNALYRSRYKGGHTYVVLGKTLVAANKMVK